MSTVEINLNFKAKKTLQDVPGGTGDKNPPANAGDMGLIPSPGRSHMLTEQLSPCATTTEPEHPRTSKLQILSPCAVTTESRVPKAYAGQQEELLR